MKSWYNPMPKYEPLRLPRRFPKKIIPSFINNDGLVLNLLMLRGAGDKVFDNSRFRNHEVIYGASWVDDGWGWALSFDGVDDYVDCRNDESLNITDAITIEAWVKQAENNDGYVIIKNTADDSKRLYAMWSQGSEDSVHFFYYDGAKEEICWNYALDDNTWHHVVITVDGLTATLYVDGVSQGDKTLSGAFQGDATAKVKIGKREPNHFHFNGTIDEVRIYNRALTQTEIQLHYQLTNSIHAN